MMDDRQLLEAAAKAAGYEVEWRSWVVDRKAIGGHCFAFKGRCAYWNPLVDDGDRYALAKKLRLFTVNRSLLDGFLSAYTLEGMHPDKALDLAIVRAAAEMGKDL